MISIKDLLLSTVSITFSDYFLFQKVFVCSFVLLESKVEKKKIDDFFLIIMMLEKRKRERLEEAYFTQEGEKTRK